MARDGTGVYALPAGNPVQTGTTISSSNYIATLNDIAAALSQSLSKDGQTVPTANLPMGGNKLIGLANGTAADDAAAFGQIAAAIAQIVNSRDGVRGLIGTNNAATPLTKYDLSADAVTLRNAAGNTVTRYVTGTITCDLGVSTAANGRDQVGAFSASSWVYLYFIWNGTTLATLASLTAPTSFNGSTLPTGYTHWAFATALRWNGSSNIVPAITKGAKVTYDVQTSSTTRALSSGNATTFTAISLASYVPPISLLARIVAIISGSHNSAIISVVQLRTTGSSSGGANVVGCGLPVPSTACQANAVVDFPLNSSQQLDYQMGVALNVSGGFYLDVLGYIVPNGGE